MAETFGLAADVRFFQDGCNPAAEGVVLIPDAAGAVVGIIVSGHALCAALSPSQMVALSGALLAAAQAALAADALANAEAAGNA